MQIAALLRTKEKSITVRYISEMTCKSKCQLQKGSADCGLIALAFASVIASGGHPSAYLFDQQSLRKHLHDYIVSGAYIPFPVKKIS